MNRFVFRLLGYLLIAAGFAALVIDGTTSIASGVLKLTSVDTVLRLVSAEWMAEARVMADAKFGSQIWRDVVAPVIGLPAFGAFMVIGLLSVFLGRRPRPQIGFQPL